MDIMEFLVQNVVIFVLNLISIFFVTLLQRNLSRMMAWNLEISVGSRV